MQSLIYTDIQPISTEKHADLSIKAGDYYGFVQHTNAVPLTAFEFSKAAASITIVFAGESEKLTPVAILGLKEHENKFVSDNGDWVGGYIPAFVRCYPFIFASSPENDTLTLCIDESFQGCNYTGRGERLFDADGIHTQYFDQVIEFQKTYQAQAKRTESFCQKLQKLELLEPSGVEFISNDGARHTLSGFHAVDRSKLKALDGDTLSKLAAADELELIYIHLQSIQNLRNMPSSV